MGLFEEHYSVLKYRFIFPSKDLFCLFMSIWYICVKDQTQVYLQLTCQCRARIRAFKSTLLMKTIMHPLQYIFSNPS